MRKHGAKSIMEKNAMKSFLKIPAGLLFSLLCCHAGSTPVAAQAPAFEELRVQHNATRIESSPALRAQTAALAGQVVDLQGEVAGIVSRDGDRTVLLKMGDDMTILTAPNGMKDNGLLRTGVLVRVLARVANGGENELPSIVAITEGAASLLASIESGDGAEITLPVTATIEKVPQASRPAIKPPVKKAPAPKAAPPKQVQFKKGAATLPANKPTAGEVDELIESQVSAYDAIVRRHNKKLRPEVVREISVAMLRAGYLHDMDPRFLAAIIAVESDFDVYCRSRSGALGLGQMMPFNLKEAGVRDPWNPTQNVMGTARLLRNLLNSYKGRSNSTLLAVAAYNAGSGAVRRAGYKVPKGAQVQRYVWKVYYRYKEFAPDMFD